MTPDPHPPYTIKRYISAGELVRQLNEQLETNLNASAKANQIAVREWRGKRKKKNRNTHDPQTLQAIPILVRTADRQRVVRHHPAVQNIL